MGTYSRYFVLLCASAGFILVVPFLFSDMLSVDAHAEVYNCDGTWSNKPCDQLPIKKLDDETGPKISRITGGGTKSSGVKDGSVKIGKVVKDAARIKDIDKEVEGDLAENKKLQDEIRMLEQKKINLERQKKSDLARTLRDMNRACDNYYNLTEIKSFESYCKRSSTTYEKCHKRWNEEYAEILGQVRDEKCRNKIFQLSDQHK